MFKVEFLKSLFLVLFINFVYKKNNPTNSESKEYECHCISSLNLRTGEPIYTFFLNIHFNYLA